MVSIVGGIIGLVLLIIVGLIAISFIGTSIVDLTQAGQDLLDALKIDIKPVVGERVCDISIVLSGDLRGDFSGVIVDNVQKQYQWFDCHDSTSVPFFSLFNSNDGIGIFRENLSLLTFGECFDLHVTLVDQSGQRRSSPIKSICVGAGILDSPFQLEKIFVFDNIPDRNYDIELYFDNPTIHIKDHSSMQPKVERLCKVGLTSC